MRKFLIVAAIFASCAAARADEIAITVGEGFVVLDALKGVQAVKRKVKDGDRWTETELALSDPVRIAIIKDKNRLTAALEPYQKDVAAALAGRCGPVRQATECAADKLAEFNKDYAAIAAKSLKLDLIPLTREDLQEGKDIPMPIVGALAPIAPWVR
ncbi:hypothetical protein [Methylocystis heyeri]|uniref:Uncharacterized protein n=1 Tax=Methylocystis heyeri TaxID=391905 RepID=A0A6B8KGA4_9HYPH|nr:hypothetical protein [Methylocystis heyeri]QGM46747.1 hypothetical protein H2LOC_014170 [Methylocystis heyeri]